jgi:hypothetical protein
MTEPDLSEFHGLTELEELRRANATLQRQLRRAKQKTEDLVAATLEGSKAAMVALGPVPAVPKPKADRRLKPEVALWHLTDWQGAKLTTSYNSEVMRERVMRYCDTAERLTQIKRTAIPVRECVILFGGDMGEGLFNFPNQPFEVDATIFTQYAQIARVEVDVVRRALALYEKVTVISEWGNHGRIGSKRAAVPNADNFDRMTYELARALLGEEPRLTWEDSAEDIQRVEIGNYRALLIHGDEVGRNGYASPMTIVNHVAKWQSGSYDWAFRDCYLGHYHTHNEWALPNGLGSVYQTGSPETDNRYAGVHMAASARPSQRLHFIDPDKGRVTDQYKVWLEA